MYHVFYLDAELDVDFYCTTFGERYTDSIMTKSVLISYKWDEERGETRWLFWLQKKLEAQNFSVIMSPLQTPRQETSTWISDIQALYSVPEEHVYIVEHDPGCLTILKYLEYLDRTQHIDTALLVAGKSKTPQGMHNQYIRLEGAKEIAIFNPENNSPDNQSQFQNVDAKLVVLYSSGEILLEEKRKKQLKNGSGGFLKKLLGR